MVDEIQRFLGCALICVAAIGCSSPSAGKPLNTVADVDLNRYAGDWHEIGRLPNRFQTKCAGNVTASYSLRDDGRIDVINRCRKSDGSEMQAKGVARRAKKDGPASRLEVRFAPAWLSAIPAVWGDYQVMELAPNYSWVLIGEPERRYLWILARSPEMQEFTYRELVDRAAAQGFDMKSFVRTPFLD